MIVAYVCDVDKNVAKLITVGISWTLRSLFLSLCQAGPENDVETIQTIQSQPIHRLVFPWVARLYGVCCDVHDHVFLVHLK